MTREEAIEKIINGFCNLRVWCELYPDNCQKEDCEMWWAIEALSADAPSSDLISRQNAIRWVKTECNPYGKPTLDFESGKKVIEHLEQVPSADRPTGEWVSNHDGTWNCSECGLRVFVYAKGNYCPNCGAEIEYRIPLDDDTCE